MTLVDVGGEFIDAFNLPLVSVVVLLASDGNKNVDPLANEVVDRCLVWKILRSYGTDEDVDGTLPAEISIRTAVHISTDRSAHLRRAGRWVCGQVAGYCRRDER